MKKFVLISCVITTIMLLNACNKKDLQTAKSSFSLSAANQTDSSIVQLSTIIKMTEIPATSSAKNKAVAIAAQGITGNLHGIKTISKDGVPYFYIVNAGNDNGWTILSADVNYMPVLACSESGNFDSSKISGGLNAWFNVHYKNIRHIRNSVQSISDSTFKKKNRAAWRSLAMNTGNTALQQQINTIAASEGKEVSTIPVGGSITTERIVDSTKSVIVLDVEPLCVTEWNQSYPYNMYCPAVSTSYLSSSINSGYGGYCPTGCVPTAMAQVMYFWKYPATYNWSAMNTDWPWFYTLASGENTDCSKLMYAIGSTIVGGSKFASYGDTATGANMGNCVYVFSQFGYSAQYHGTANGTAYGTFLFNEVSNNLRPCIASGFLSSNGSGHAWVCDGCREVVDSIYETTIRTVYASDNSIQSQTTIPNGTAAAYSIQQLLYMNWGWGGADNGWFDCSVDYTDPTSTEDFSYSQQIIYNIHPNN